MTSHGRDFQIETTMVLRYSVLNGSLEPLPETLATMAIRPLQMKMLWRIGKAAVWGCPIAN